jgi:hypothetical protein
VSKDALGRRRPADVPPTNHEDPVGITLPFL